jgi:ribosomal protein L31
LKDSLEDNYLAFYIAVVWYEEITPEQAFAMLECKTKPRVALKTIHTLTNEELNAIVTRATHPRFTDKRKLCKKYGISEHLLDSIIKSV